MRESKGRKFKMVYFFNGAGCLRRCVPEYVYQGSADANSAVLVGPFDESTQVSVVFRMPDGESTSKIYMQYQGDASAYNADGEALHCWIAEIPSLVTARYGKVFVQFFRNGAQGEILATEKTAFTVERGVAGELPDVPDTDTYDKILAVLTQIKADVKNAAYAARALYGWNSAFVYARNEIAYCPDAYEHGSFVRSLIAENRQPPYDETGSLNAAAWEEVCRFDDIYESAAQAVAAQEAASKSAETASQSAAEAVSAKNSASSDSASARESRESCERAASEAMTAAETALKAAEEAEQIAGGNFVLQKDFEEILDGTVKVGKSVSADSAQKASQDGQGHVISDTYATKTEFSQAVLVSAQSFSAQQKLQARQNIGAVSSDGSVLSAQQIGSENDVVIGKSLTSIEAGKLYLCCNLQNITVQGGGTYFFEKCKGTLTAGDSATKLYIQNSPELLINEINALNWKNIFVDGKASFAVYESTTGITVGQTYTDATLITNIRAADRTYVYTDYGNGLASIGAISSGVNYCGIAVCSSTMSTFDKIVGIPFLLYGSNQFRFDRAGQIEVSKEGGAKFNPLEDAHILKIVCEVDA